MLVTHYLVHNTSAAAGLQLSLRITVPEFFFSFQGEKNNNIYVGKKKTNIDEKQSLLLMISYR